MSSDCLGTRDAEKEGEKGTLPRWKVKKTVQSYSCSIS